MNGNFNGNSEVYIDKVQDKTGEHNRGTYE